MRTRCGPWVSSVSQSQFLGLLLTAMSHPDSVLPSVKWGNEPSCPCQGHFGDTTGCCNLIGESDGKVLQTQSSVKPRAVELALCPPFLLPPESRKLLQGTETWGTRLTGFHVQLALPNCTGMEGHFRASVSLAVKQAK